MCNVRKFIGSIVNGVLVAALSDFLLLILAGQSLVVVHAAEFVEMEVAVETVRALLKK